MAVQFTSEQKQAIETLDRSILVSAAAGSGKTAILVERILRIILEGRAGVDELLVVTFTRAAAAEMKTRLSRRIRRHMSQHPEDADMLRDQLSRMYRAYITSIDSFANRIDKEFFYEIDIEPDFNTCDEIQAELFKRDAADELVSDLFEQDDMVAGCSFREFMRLYSNERSEESFKQELISAYNRLRTMPEYFSWARERAELLLITPETLEGSELQKVMAADAREAFASACDAAGRVRRMMADAGLEDFCNEKLGDELEWIEDIYGELSDGRFDTALTERIASYSKFAVLRSNKKVKESYEPIKDEIKLLRDCYKDEIRKWKETYLGSGLEVRLREMNDTYKYTMYYISLLEEFEKRYAERKRERRVIDFADMEHYAVSILSRDEAADILRRRFKYIFVDEYQDTNNIQEYLISKIARPDNVFKVGDVKQSIYKFRQAEPEIFERVYREYSDPECGSGITIDLSRNFRTNARTIGYVNKVFRSLMEGYDDRAALYAGIECEDKYDFIPEVHILTTEPAAVAGPSESADASDRAAATADASGASDRAAATADASGASDRAAATADTSDASDRTAATADASGAPDRAAATADTAGASDMPVVDDAALDLSKDEAESAYISGIVESIIGTEFYDTKAGVVRKAEPRDIAILYRSVKVTGDILVRSLKSRNISAHVEEAEKYFDTVEIGVAMSILMCIDNMKRDVPLIAAMHSQVFDWSPEELAAIRIAHSDHLHELRAAEPVEDGQADLVVQSAQSDPAVRKIQSDSDKQSEKADPATLKIQSEPVVQNAQPAQSAIKRAAYWEALKWYTEEGPDGGLRDKARRTVDTILGWRRLSRMMPLGDFVWKILIDSGYYMAAGAMNGGARRQANLRTLADKAEQFSRESVASLSSFVTFLDLLRQRDSGNFAQPAAGGSDNVVRISTIHKSKGLEYPFVIVGGMGRMLRHPGGSGQFSFEPSVGVGLRYVDPSRKYYRSTLMQCAIKAKTERDTYKENLRVLYVAMTRARNKLIMVGTYKNEEELMKYTTHPDSYLKMMREVIMTPYNEYRISPLDTGQAVRAEKHAALPDPAAVRLDAQAEAVYSEIDRRFTYKYPYEDMLTAKAKYSVSQIRRMELEAAEASGDTAASDTDPEPVYTSAKSDDEVVRLHNIAELTGKRAARTDIGIAYHRIMEFLDFAGVIGVRRMPGTAGTTIAANASDEQAAAGTTIAANESDKTRAAVAADFLAPAGFVDEEYIRERAEFLVKSNAIDADVYRYVDLGRIAGFFRTDLGRRAAVAAARGKLRKEKPFTLRTTRIIRGTDGTDAISAAAAMGDAASGAPRQILVQGVIDCCFEENGSMILIDYKSSFVRPGRHHREEIERIRREYRPQIELYAEAIRKGTGLEVSEAYLYLFTTGEAVRI